MKTMAAMIFALILAPAYAAELNTFLSCVEQNGGLLSLELESDGKRIYPTFHWPTGTTIHGESEGRAEELEIRMEACGGDRDSHLAFLGKWAHCDKKDGFWMSIYGTSTFPLARLSDMVPHLPYRARYAGGGYRLTSLAGTSSGRLGSFPAADMICRRIR